MRNSVGRLIALSAILAFTACEQESCDCSGGAGTTGQSGSGSGSAAPEASGASAAAPAKTLMKIASGFDPSRLGKESLPDDWAEQAIGVYASDCLEGDSRACVLEGNAYLDGVGTKQDWNKAREIFETQCNKDNYAACLNLRNAYRFEQGVAKDPAKEEALLAKALTGASAACKGGTSAISCLAAADAYRESKPATDGRSVDRELFDLYETGCKQGVVQSCLELGTRVVQVEDQSIAASGLQFLRQSCTAGFEQGCEMLQKYEPLLKEVEAKAAGRGK